MINAKISDNWYYDCIYSDKYGIKNLKYSRNIVKQQIQLKNLSNSLIAKGSKYYQEKTKERDFTPRIRL